ncbi:MAG: DUF1385 domain-containing protein [Clostridiales Family XIII bacterium]|jgi:uncharacterized protein YqhQ|nr:DUF1385 domain-containing protein [Clostridiales Family XIII bacterium]
MDFEKIFIKDACPTKIGGQAVMEGIMMKGADRTAVVVRLPDSSLYMKTQLLKKRGRWYRIPVVRGILVFADSLVTGVKTLMLSAELLESCESEEDGGNDDAGRFTLWLQKRFGEKAPLNLALATSVALALVFTVGIFIIAPTWIVNVFGRWMESDIALNLTEGLFRILLFVLYIVLISNMKDIRTVFQFHGAEHSCIHCFESGLALTPENCGKFETLHPRCGTSFLMFVMVIALLLFSVLGWPNLAVRILSRLALIPIIAGLSYELLRWAGNSLSPAVKILSVPGLLLQKLTTRKPDRRQLEVAIAAMKAVLVSPSTPAYEGICDTDGAPAPKQQLPPQGAAAPAEELKAMGVPIPAEEAEPPAKE